MEKCLLIYSSAKDSAEIWQKNLKKFLTSLKPDDIILRLLERPSNTGQESEKNLKKCLTNLSKRGIMTKPQKRFAPCKLNNVKHEQLAPWTKWQVVFLSESEEKPTKILEYLPGGKAQSNDWIVWKGVLIPFHWEFDPGSGRTLAACLTHASRTEFLWIEASADWDLNLVADGWVTREQPAFQWGTTVGNDC